MKLWESLRDPRQQLVPYGMALREEIIDVLTNRFRPTILEVSDVSESHRGHSGWREGGETHFEVRISSAQFAGLSRVERHRSVHKALSPKIMQKIHALSLDISSS